MDHGCIILKIDYRFVQFFFYIIYCRKHSPQQSTFERLWSEYKDEETWTAHPFQILDGDPTIVLTVNEDLL